MQMRDGVALNGGSYEFFDRSSRKLERFPLVPSAALFTSAHLRKPLKKRNAW
jgi:hypothetical protein